MNRIARTISARTIAALAIGAAVSIGTFAGAGAGTASADAPHAGARTAAHASATVGDTTDTATQKNKNKDKDKDKKGKQPPVTDPGQIAKCESDLAILNGLISTRQSQLEAAAMMTQALLNGQMSSEDYDSGAKGFNLQAGQTGRDYKAAMWVYIDDGCVAVKGPPPVLPGWTDLESAAEVLAG